MFRQALRTPSRCRGPGGGGECTFGSGEERAPGVRDFSLFLLTHGPRAEPGEGGKP